MDDFERFAKSIRRHMLGLQSCCDRRSLTVNEGLVKAFALVRDLSQRRKALAEKRYVDVLEAALAYNGRHAMEERDKLFAFLGLCHEDEVPAGFVDYDLKQPECFVKFARTLVEGTLGPKVLSHVEHPVPGAMGQSDEMGRRPGMADRPS